MRKQTGSISVLKDGSIYARVSYTDASGQRRTKYKRADSREHAELLRQELLNSVPRQIVRGKTRQIWAPISIYFVQMMDGGTQPIKIGVARNVEQRLRGLATGAPYDLKLLATWVATAPAETIIHGRFRHLRMNGEWFRPAPELLAFIKSQGLVKG